MDEILSFEDSPVLKKPEVAILTNKCDDLASKHDEFQDNFAAKNPYQMSLDLLKNNMFEFQLKPL